jgi:hypothetical protein
MAPDSPTNPFSPSGPGRIAEGWNEAVLARIHEPGVSAALWTRGLTGGLRRAVASLSCNDIVSMRCKGRTSDIHDAIERALTTQINAGKADLHLDLNRLVAQFARLAGDNTPLNASLRSIDHDACEEFHEDVLALRLIVTYRGATTEWRDPAAPQMAHLPSVQARAGDVLVFRGALMSDRTTPALLHRSPAVERAQDWRLVFSISSGAS